MPSSTAGTFDVYIQGSEQPDTFLLHSFLIDNTMIVESNGGNDTFDIQDLSKAEVDIYGGVGDDLYLIEMVQGVDFRNLRIFDSIDAEADRVSLRGTLLDETFIMTSNTFDDLNVDVRRDRGVRRAGAAVVTTPFTSAILTLPVYRRRGWK